MPQLDAIKRYQKYVIPFYYNMPPKLEETSDIKQIRCLNFFI